MRCSDKGFVGNKYRFLLLAPVGTRKGFKKVDTGQGAWDMQEPYSDVAEVPPAPCNIRHCLELLGKVPISVDTWGM